MKIFIPATGPSIKDCIDNKFGGAKYHVVYNLKNDSYNTYQNHFCDEGIKDAGSQIAILIVELRIKTLITNRVDINSFNILDKNDIEIYQSEAGITLEEAITLFRMKRLPLSNQAYRDTYYHLVHKN